MTGSMKCYRYDSELRQSRVDSIMFRRLGYVTAGLITALARGLSRFKRLCGIARLWDKGIYAFMRCNRGHYTGLDVGVDLLQFDQPHSME